MTSAISFRRLTLTYVIMAEEDDDVDILGDFSLDNLLSKDDGRLGSCYATGVLGPQTAELLNCDYTIGSQWLLDTPNQSCWCTSPDDSKPCVHQQFGFPSSLANGVSDNLPSTSQWEESDNWTQKEKSLLEQGLELFGPSWPRLSQLIGTKTSQQVKSYVTSRNLHFNKRVENLSCESTDHCSSDVFNVSELIDDMQIPASMEEVIAVVSTAQPTVPTVHRKNLAALSRDSSLEESVKRKGSHDTSRVKNRKGRLQSAHHRLLSSKRPAKTAPLLPKRTKTEAKASVLKLSANEEVIKIKKESSGDSDDGEIEVDDDDLRGECAAQQLQRERQLEEEKKVEMSLIEQAERESDESKPESQSEEEGSGTAAASQSMDDAAHSHHDALEVIDNMPPPSKEAILDSLAITDEERAIHAEFFEGRTAKTPKRYLRIRNHILECWQQNRPMYVTKTSVRAGLKHCGDVNCIGRIHAYLEQIGAINFGCEQARYLNPLPLAPPLVVARRKPSKEQLAAMQQARIDAMRPRKKKQSPIILDGDGGYTITHNESGEAVHTTVVQDAPTRGYKGHRTAKSNLIELISCSKYSANKPAPFRVLMSVEALLVVDLHAHSSHTEVAGLLGGRFDLDRGVLHIRRALACRVSGSSTHCDMCPVSQNEAHEVLQNDGLRVVGWYHSHPTFLPNPSLQDLSTHADLQQWFATTAAPVVSFILTPYCPTNPTYASEYRCLTVDCAETTRNIYGTPYMYAVKVSADGLNVSSMLRDMAAIFSLVEEHPDVAVDFDAEFQHGQAVTYEQKCVRSAMLHLASCNPKVPASLQDDVQQGILKACSTLNLAREKSRSRSNT